ncbi:hypothetical protein C4K26_2915 [Pseudomonas chlororaphis]|nr:hypothetical protein C4K26_2915 [Pseudomonas chlororaphis]
MAHGALPGFLPIIIAKAVNAIFICENIVHLWQWIRPAFPKNTHDLDIDPVNTGPNQKCRNMLRLHQMHVYLAQMQRSCAPPSLDRRASRAKKTKNIARDHRSQKLTAATPSPGKCLPGLS